MALLVIDGLDMLTRIRECIPRPEECEAVSICGDEETAHCAFGGQFRATAVYLRYRRHGAGMQATL